MNLENALDESTRLVKPPTHVQCSFALLISENS